MIGPPAADGVPGHTKVTAMCGLVVTGQVMVVVSEVALAEQMSWPVAPRVVVTEQALAGTV